jgi:hypothetical protein
MSVFKDRVEKTDPVDLGIDEVTIDTTLIKNIACKEATPSAAGGTDMADATAAGATVCLSSSTGALKVAVADAEGAGEGVLASHASTTAVKKAAADAAAAGGESLLLPHWPM